MKSINTATQQTKIFGDNDGAMASAKDPMFHSRMKHIDVKWHAIRDWVTRKIITIQRTSTHTMVADSLTKAVNFDKTKYCRDHMGCLEREGVL